MGPTMYLYEKAREAYYHDLRRQMEERRLLVRLPLCRSMSRRAPAWSRWGTSWPLSGQIRRCWLIARKLYRWHFQHQTWTRTRACHTANPIEQAVRAGALRSRQAEATDPPRGAPTPQRDHSLRPGQSIHAGHTPGARG